jgi:uncharacterized protein YjdB
VLDGSKDRVRRINRSGIISAYAGSGEIGFSGDGGPAINAQLYSPRGLSIDKNRNLSRVTVTVKGKGTLVENIQLESEEISLETGKTYQIKPTILPSNATNKNITYETSDSRIAIVSDQGLISAKLSGTCTITAYGANNKSISMKVNISN